MRYLIMRSVSTTRYSSSIISDTFIYSSLTVEWLNGGGGGNRTPRGN